MCSNICSTFSWFDSYVHNVLIPVQQTKLGVGWDNTITTLSSINPKEFSNYQLKFLIPYAKQTLSWEMYFNPLYPELGPDLIFDVEEYLPCNNINNFVCYIPSLVKWNRICNKCLLQVLIELRENFKEHQVTLLELYVGQKIATQYKKLTKKFHCLEIIVNRQFKESECTFFIQLHFETPEILFHKPIDVDVLLCISIYGSTWKRVIPELYLSSYLENLFNGTDSLHIPPLYKFQYLHKYAEKLKKVIINKIIAVSKSIQKKKNFIANLILSYPSNIIEYDSIEYKKVSLLFSHLNFYFILNFSLPIKFPDEKCSIILQSVYHMTDEGKPFHKTLDNFPYDSQWKPKYMISNIIEYIFEEIIKLPDICTKFL